MEQPDPPFLAVGLVEVGVARDRRRHRTGHANAQCDIPGDRRDGPGNCEKVGGHHHRPGTEWYVGQRRMKRVTERLGAVHQVLEEPARSSQDFIAPADGLLDRIGQPVQPILPANERVDGILGGLGRRPTFDVRFHVFSLLALGDRGRNSRRSCRTAVQVMLMESELVIV